MSRAGIALIVAVGALAALLVARGVDSDRIAGLAERNTVLRHEVDALAKSAEWHSAQFAAARERETAANLALADARAAASAAAAALDELRATLQAVQAELAETRLARDRAEAERGLMASALEQAQARGARVLGEQSDEARRLAGELQAARAQLADAREALATAEEQQRQLAARLEPTGVLLSEAQNLAEDRRAEIETQRAQAGAADAAEIERLGVALDDLRRQRDEARADQQRQAAWIETQAAAVTVLEERLAVEQQARLSAEQSLVARDSRLLERVDMLEKALAGATRSLNQLDAENAEMASETTELQASLEAARVERESAIAELQASLEAARAERDSAFAELRAVQAAQEAADGQLASVSAERDRLRARLEALAASKGTLEEQLAATSDELDAARSRAAGLTAGYEQLLARSALLSTLTDSQREEIEQARRALEAAQQEVVRLSGARGIYTVQNGDSLSEIARFFYRNGNLWPKVMRANAHLIGSNPDLIFAGMVLIVPH